jgi:hypothetical protein
MTSISSRLSRLFCCLLILSGLAFTAEPNKTIISDTIYRADGTTASGMISISWPAFVTADGKPVAAGSMHVKIGANGSVNIPLVPTQGATPSGSYYKVVLTLDELKAHMRWLIGNGKPGCIQELTARVDRHEQLVQRLTGIGGALAGLLTLLHIAVDYLKLHR